MVAVEESSMSARREDNGQIRTGKRRRERRPPEQARRLILRAAEALLAEGGLGAVTVRSVAERIGMTDMAVYHHFGSHERLLEALLDDVAARLREEITLLAAAWRREGARLGSLVELLARLYKAGHTRLAMALHEAGWRDRGTPILEPIVGELHAARLHRLRRPIDIDDTRLAVAALHQALALEPAFGAEFRRSAGLTGKRAANAMSQRRWWIRTMAQRLGLPE
jgi:AcrR family transcriptional regulator